ncbi:MAG TPA: toll/interleukin-1 receptor domain-containing protein [Rhizomicrobium sp.]|jgi:hypothetical protein|nr:toll/interleukin-1 receptor domain-containing protein [Rhizomicrobium sp.]
MADIFISYAREDREWVEKLANGLVTEGFTVWWDWDLLVGKRYRETIETELQTAKAAVVVWSQHSIRSDFVRDEAEDAQQRNILLPVLKEIVRPPAGFRQLQTADLSHWAGGGEHVEFRRMMKGVASLIGRPAAGDTGVIAVDPAHPTTHFTPSPADAAPPAEAAPATPPADSPPLSAAKAPEPAVAPVVAPIAMEAALPPRPAAPPAPLPVAPPAANPIVRYVVIGVVVLVALLFIVIQFVVPSLTKAPAKPSAPATVNAGGAATPPATTHAGTPPPAATGGTPADGAASGDDGGDVGQSGPHGGATPPPSNPSNNGGSDDSGDSGDTGQGNNPH